MLDFRMKLIGSQPELLSLVARLGAIPALAVDIETVNWWDRRIERVALIQIAFREGHQLKAAVIVALVGLDLEPLRATLEVSPTPRRCTTRPTMRCASHATFKYVPPPFTTRCGPRAKAARNATHFRHRPKLISAFTSTRVHGLASHLLSRVGPQLPERRSLALADLEP